jgi:lactoylglutathione lyase
MPQHSLSEVGVQQLVPLLVVRDMDASLRFYIDGLGFTMSDKWTPEGKVRWCWLDHGNASLMLQEFAPGNEGYSGLAGNLAPGVGFNFICRDALAFYHVMADRGIVADRPFVGNHMWVTTVHDPDGYSLHFESRTDAPEESVYKG